MGAINLVNLFRGRKRTEIDTLKIDATTGISHTGSAELTDFPTQKGVINDNVIQKPDVITITGEISQTPLNLGPLTPIAAIFARDKIQTARQQLEDLKDAGEPFDVVNKLRVYDNMVLVGLVMSMSDSREVLTVNLTLKNAVIVETRTIVTQDLPEDQKDKLQKVEARQRQEASVANDEVQKKGGSFLFNAGDSLSGGKFTEGKKFLEALNESLDKAAGG